MRKLVILTISIVAFLQCGFGQELYRDGFILKSPFDTIHGKIKYYSYNQAALQCVFRNIDTGEEKVFQPNEIFGYGIDKDLLFSSKSISENKSLFLEVVYQGTIILYSYRDKYRKDYFYLENRKTGDFRALTQKTIGTKRQRSTVKTFQNILKIMLDKSELIQDRIESTSLSYKSLTNLLVEYDKRYARYNGRVFNGSRKQWPPTPGVYFIQGIAQQKLNDHSGTGSSFLFGIGVKFQKEVSRGTKRLFLDMDISLSSEKFNQVYSRSEEITDQSIISNGLNYFFSSTPTTIRGNVNHTTIIDMERINLALPINLKYVFPGSKWLFTVNGGISPQHSVKKSGRIQGLLEQNDALLLDIISREETERFRMAVNIGFGIMLKSKNTFFLDFQHSPTWLNQGVLKYKYSFLRLGMLLEKK